MTDSFFIHLAEQAQALLGLMAALLAVFILAAVYAIASFMRQHQLDLKRLRRRGPGFAELLNYAALIDDGIILLKNGGLLAAFGYQGIDLSAASNLERNELSRRLNELFAPLDSGWMIHVDAVRAPVPAYFPYNASAFPDKVSRAIDEERRQIFTAKGAMYDVSFVISFTYLPPLLATRKLVEAMYEKDGTQLNPQQRTRQILEEFKLKLHSIERDLKNIFPEVTRLGLEMRDLPEGGQCAYDWLLSWVQDCITGNMQPMRVPSDPIYLDGILGGQDFSGGVMPVIGRKKIKVISIENYGGSTVPGMFSLLSEIGSPYRWSTRFIFIERHKAAAHTKKLRKFWQQKVRGMLAQFFNIQTTPNQDAVGMVEQAENIEAEISAGIVSYGFLTDVIVLMNEDVKALNADADLVITAVQALGLTARVESVNAVEAYLGSLPGHCYENVRRPLINTLNLADLIPSSTPFAGQSFAPCPFYPDNHNLPPLMKCLTGTMLNTPFYLNLHHPSDVGHTLIFGPTGSGKSTLLVTLAAQFLRYRDAQIFCFDKGLSMYTLCQAVHGLHFNPAAEGSGLAFAPFDDLSEDDAGWACDWLEVILKLNLKAEEVDTKLRNAVQTALLNMVRARQARPDLKISLTTLSAAVQDQTFREVMKSYTGNTTVGRLLNAEHDGLGFANFTVFELESLMNLGDRFALPVLLYIFRRIEKALKGKPALIILDEAWIMLGHPTFKNKIKEWLKVLRKANCAVVMATQSIADAQASGILMDLRDQTATKIFLPNPTVLEESTAALYKQFGLNAAQLKLIAYATPKRDYFLKVNDGSRLFQLGLTPRQLAFIGVSDKEDLAKVKELREQYAGDHWIIPWLKYKRVDWPELVNAIQEENKHE